MCSNMNDLNDMRNSDQNGVEHNDSDQRKKEERFAAVVNFVTDRVEAQSFIVPVCCREEKKLLPNEKVVLIGFLFIMASIGTALCNKYVFYTFNFFYPSIILLIENTMIVIIFQIVAQKNEQIRLSVSKPSFDDLRECFVPALFYNVHMLLSLITINQMDISSNSLIKRLSPIVMTVMMSASSELRKKVNVYLLPGSLLLTVGAVIGVVGKDGFKTHPLPIISGVGCVIFKCLYILSLRGQCKYKSLWTVTYLVSLTSIVLQLFICLVLNEHQRLYMEISTLDAKFINLSFWFGVVGVLIIGVMLVLLSAALSKFTKSMTISVLTNFKSTALAISGMFIFDGVVDWFVVAGIVICFTGAVLYTILNNICRLKEQESDNSDESDLENSCHSVSDNSPDQTPRHCLSLCCLKSPKSLSDSVADSDDTDFKIADDCDSVPPAYDNDAYCSTPSDEGSPNFEQTRRRYSVCSCP